MRTFLLLIIFFSSFSSSAQELRHDTRYPGYFINVKNDTIRGYILVSNKLDNQKVAEYSNDPKGEKIVIRLLPDEVRGFKVQDRIYTALSYGDPDPALDHFLLTLDERYLKVYEYFFLPHNEYVVGANSNHPATGYDEQLLQFEFVVVKKDNTQVPIATQNALLKHSKELFGDDTDLLKKISDKEKGYHFNDLPAIVKEYNDWKVKQ